MTAHRARLTRLVADAPAEAYAGRCDRRQQRAIAEPALLPWCVLALSRMYPVRRGRVSERLASHGIVMAAPDHADNTLWDQLEARP
jgi:hypothetical protein